MRRIILCCLVMLALGSLVAISSLAYAQSGGYDLTWNTIDGGGHIFSAGNGYELSGTIGQPDAGVLSGGGYTLSGGFWNDAVSFGVNRIYLPIVLR